MDAADEIEIPEPDYDDDDDDDNEEEDTQNDDITTSVTDDVTTTVECCHDDEERTYSFDEVRAKLEAYSRDELRVLAAALAPEIEIPDPDYSDSDPDDDDAAICPKKVENSVASKEHQQLLRELLRNQKLGVNVLSKKSELDREFEKRKLQQERREEAEMQRKKRSSFDERMEQQANKLLQAEQQAAMSDVTTNEIDNQTEFIKVHSKINKLKSAS